MSGTPKRWLDDPGEEGPALRSILKAGEQMDPPAGEEKQVWAALLARLPPPPPGGGGGSSSGGSASGAGSTSGASAGAAPAASKAALAAAAGGGMLKSMLIGAGGALAVIGVYTVAVPDAPEPAAPVEQSAPAESARASEPARPGLLPNVTARATVSPPVDSAAAPVPRSSAGDLGAAERETRLREESRRLSEARDALRRGDAAGALALLDEMRRKFPQGTLAQERETLAVEALTRSGRTDEAKARAASFKDAYPESPHGVRVDAFAGDAGSK